MLQSNTDPLHLRDYLFVLRRRIWLILAAFIVTVVSTFLSLQRQPPKYEAQAILVVKPKDERFIRPDLMDLATQKELIRTPTVLGEVVRQLGLSTAPADSPEFQAARTDLRQRIRLNTIPKTRIITIKATHTSPKLARDIANTVAQVYDDQNRRSRLQAERDAMGGVSAQLGDVEARLQQAEQAVQRFREKEQMVSLNDRRNEEIKAISQFNAKYIDTQVRRLELSTLIEQFSMETADADIPVTALKDPSLQQFGTEFVRLQTQLAEKRQNFKDTYPGVIELKSKIELTRQNIIGELEKQHRILQIQEQSFLELLNQRRVQAVDLGNKEIEYSALEREVRINRQMYDTLLTRLNKLSLAEGTTSLNRVRIEALAGLPANPAGKNKRLMLVIGGVLGLALGIGAAFFLEYLRTNVRTPEDDSGLSSSD